MKKILLVFLASAAVAVGAAGYFSIKYSDRIISSYYLGKAGAAHEQNREARAAYFYEEALRHNPQNSAARIACASLMFEMGNDSQAEKELLNCIKLSPDNPEGYLKLCAVYVSQNRIYEAAELLNNIDSEYAKTKIGAVRPDAPVLSPAPGRYTSCIKLSAAVPENTECYYSMDSEPPSLDISWNDGPDIKTGASTVYAVCVSQDGVVSDICRAGYKIDDYTVRVEFKDRTIEQMTRAALGRYTGHITVGDIKQIKSLSNRTVDGQKIGAEINSFSDFQNFKELTELCLYDLGELPELNGLSVLPALNSLSLVNCGITSDKAMDLKSIKNIEVLNLCDNKLSDMSFISGISKLRCLSVKNNFIGDLTPLLLFSDKLTYLDLSGNKPGSTDSLSSMTAVEQLNLSNCGLYDIECVKNLKNLTYLDVSKNKIKSLEPIAGCKKLKTLLAGDNLISSLTPLSELSSIAVIDIKNNSVLTLRPLFSITSLQTVNIENNRISDLSPLQNCKKLKNVAAAGNPIDDAALDTLATASVTYD